MEERVNDMANETANHMANSDAEGIKPAFSLSGVKFKHILDIETLDIPSRKATCIVGPSGGGKSTLLKMLNRMVSPDAGVVRFAGRDVRDFDPVELRRRVVMLPQTPVVFPGNIRENLEIGCRLSERPVPEEGALAAALSMVSLRQGLGDDPTKLSGGEKQRLALARILLMDPEVLLLDEPSSALDQETEKVIVDTVSGYARDKGKTLVMVTHSPAVADRYADLLVRVVDGRVAEVRAKDRAELDQAGQDQVKGGGER